METCTKVQSMRPRRGLPSVDRISNLPDELLIQVLSCLPTKDVVATSVLSRRWRYLYTWMTDLEFDASPIYGLSQRRDHQLIARFTDFVQNVLQTRQPAGNLSRFCVKAKDEIKYKHVHNSYFFPDMKSAIIGNWISLSLAQGVRELDLCVYITQERLRMPPDVFSCGTLEVLKLCTNLSPEHPKSFNLPKLKVCHLKGMHLPEGGFLSGLLSGSPSLEDLAVENCSCADKELIISNPSLRELILDLSIVRYHFRNNKLDFTESGTKNNLVLDTPNLHYFEYVDELGDEYSAGAMNSLKQAFIVLYSYGEFESLVSLLTPLANVQTLSLYGVWSGALEGEELKDELPVFRNLNHLYLALEDHRQWRRVLLELLHSSPSLQMLTLTSADRYDEDRPIDTSLLGTTEGIPSCLMYHVKRIVIMKDWPIETSLDMVEYLLKNASVLQELEVEVELKPGMTRSRVSEGELKKLPRSSTNCSIKVLQCH